MATVRIEDLVRELQLEVLYRSSRKTLDLVVADFNRPGLQLAGFMDYFAVERIQLFGKVELSFMTNAMDPGRRKMALLEIFRQPIPCAIISRGATPPDELLDAAMLFNRPVFRTQRETSQISVDLTNYQEALLAPTITRHAGLVDVNGLGLLILGESGIGKSETMLELITRGHRLVADDVVEIQKVSWNQLVGQAPENIRYYMEIRGIGIVDMRRMYGTGSVLASKSIDMIIELENWDSGKQYYRLGLDEETETILGVTLPHLTVPIRPGRNIGIILEVAVRNYQLKISGYNAAGELVRRFEQTD